MRPPTNIAIHLDHVERLTGPLGLYEHALLDRPRVSHGYTTDDNARLLVLLSRLGAEPDCWQPYLRFVTVGLTPNGWHNRMSIAGAWQDRIGSDDAHGRAVWGLGEAAQAGRLDSSGFEVLERGLEFTSPHPRAIAYLLLGAVAAHEVLSAAAEKALATNLPRLPRPLPGSWAWPAERLTYANARIPEALIRAGVVCGDGAAVADGLALLDWLIEIEQGESGFSFTPVGGRGPEDRRPGFDQQPIEAWAMADACSAAFDVDHHPRWFGGLVGAAEWFLGRNDAGLPLYDPVTGAGQDGLGRSSVNRNQGSESTLAALAALLRLHHLTEDSV